MIAMLHGMDVKQSDDGDVIFIRDGIHYVVTPLGLEESEKYNLKMEVRRLRNELDKKNMVMEDLRRRVDGLVDSRVVGVKETHKINSILDSRIADSGKVKEIRAYLFSKKKSHG